MGNRKDTLETTKGKPILPIVIDGQCLDTDQCAAFAHQALRDAGYIAEQFDSLAVLKYNDEASDRVYKDFDSNTLDKSQPYLVNMYYKGSPYLKEAFDTGTQGRTGTHTGYLVHNGKDWEVVHNIHGKAKVDKFTKIQGGGKKYGVTSIMAPRKNTLLNAIKTRLGFRNGGYVKLPVIAD